MKEKSVSKTQTTVFSEEQFYETTPLKYKDDFGVGVQD